LRRVATAIEPLNALLIRRPLPTARSLMLVLPVTAPVVPEVVVVAVVVAVAFVVVAFAALGAVIVGLSKV